MSNVRPQPKAKYQLLLENSRSPFNVKRTLVVALLIMSIIGATSIAFFLAWESLTAVEDTEFLLQMVEISKQQNFATDSLQHRTYLYGKALQNNVDNSTWMAPRLDRTVPVLLSSNPLKLVCYFNIPTSNKDLQAEKIDPTLCTHIIIAFASIYNSTLIMNSPKDGEVYQQVVALKVTNPSLKVMLSVGGADADESGFSAMVLSHSTRRNFINSTLLLLIEFQLDGIDFDWEFPSWPSDGLDRPRFTQLLSELRLEIDKRKLSLLVSVAVAATQPIIEKAYDIPAMAKYVDFVNLMSYDYHFYVWYLPETGVNAPLYSRQQEKGYFRTLNGNYTAWYWIQKGMPPEKIVLGIPTYGHSFTLVNSANNGLMAPSSGNGMLGRNGFISYSEACWFLSDGHGSGVFDLETRAPYAFKGKEWISYDDEHSISYKAQYVVNSHLGGAMIFSLNQDDFSGMCSKGRKTFPLTRQVANVLQDDQL